NEQDMIVENVSGIQLYNYPNPFTLDGRSGGTNICYSGVEEEGILTVYNIKGQKVWEYQVSGTVGNTIFWDGCNMNNQKVGSGIYFCHMISADSEGTTKLLLLK
ncbi:MAG: T9SS type A sorting domain-containing protein, partial [Candidatus Stygibacter australis]|nr:T9SS type A sorting domain-containing protein [Candidatus Stygibacter australis]